MASPHRAPALDDFRGSGSQLAFLTDHPDLMQAIPQAGQWFAASVRNETVLTVERLGAGIVLPRNRRRVEDLREAIERIMGESNFRATTERIARAISSENGPALAADELEKFVRSKKRGTD